MELIFQKCFVGCFGGSAVIIYSIFLSKCYINLNFEAVEFDFDVRLMVSNIAGHLSYLDTRCIVNFLSYS